MHRTQIYLHDDLHEKLKLRSRSSGVSMSEFIRRSLEESVAQDPAADAQAFFERLKPLESFADIEPQAYVTELRATSRLLRNPADDA